jgi:serine/threonine protein kinase
MEILDYIVNTPAPTLPNNGTFTPEFIDFLTRCLQKDPGKRDTVAQLCNHPWILKYSQNEVDIEGWVQEMQAMKKMKAKIPDIPTAKVSLQL